jgi:hypothetical protein
MTATISFNPQLSTNAAGSFGVQWDGLIQGTAYPDPAVRYYLASGFLASTETLPMWGGVGISENVPTPQAAPPLTPDISLGGSLIRATALPGASAGNLTGFSVFDQAYGMVNTPQSPVPLAGSYGQVNFYRLGSGARIAVAADPALTTLGGGIISPQVSWDFVNQRLVPYDGTLTISSGTYNNTSGLVTLTMSATVNFSAGDAIIVSSLTGTGAYASLNGTYTVLSASGTTVTYNPGAGKGASTITGGSLTLGSGASSALPVKVLRFYASNCMNVSYDSTTGFATWNRNGAGAVILI